ncbi:hypothetical protein KAX02_13360 [candidate division WOR-3 bacterium]|nr:hypothetical protein [candidate division WOR-3 bacterium]
MLYIIIVLLGVTTSYWEEREFSECEFHGVGISKDGEVVLSYDVDSIFKTQDMFLWDILSTETDIYIATGDRGKIYKIHKGKGELFFDSKDENIITLAEYGGYIYAGTSPGGKIFKIDREGRGEEILDSDEEFIWDLSINSNGQIVCGTGGNGLVLNIKDGDVDTLLKTGRANASLLQQIDGDIYVGTGDGGLLFVISQDEKPRGLYDGSIGEISGVIKIDNILHFIHCLDTISVIKKIREDGLSEEVVEIPGVSKGILDYKDMILCASDRRIYRIHQDGKYDIIYEFPTEVSSVGSNGYFGLSKLASLYCLKDRRLQEGVIESYSYDAEGVSKWGRLSYEGKGEISFQTRSGNTENPDVTWEDWKELSKDGKISSSPNRFIRWKAKISNSSSYLKTTQVAYLPLNQKPFIEFLELEFECGGLLYSGLDPDGDEVSFDIYYREIGGEWVLLQRETTDSIISVERDAFPDGVYQFKVVVSDAPSNPPEYTLTSFKVSDLYRMDNTPPLIRIEIKGDKAIVIVNDNMSEIASLEYSENASEFASIYPVDGIFDQMEERFEIILKQGTRHLVVRTRDRKDNFSLQKWTK